MKYKTLGQILSCNPCYSEKKIIKLLAGRKKISAQAILKLDIPDKDKIWAVLRFEYFSQKELVLIACEIAMTTLSIFEKKYPEDRRPRDAIKAARKWVKNPSKDNHFAAATANAAANAAAAAAKKDQHKKNIKIIKKYLRKAVK